MSMQETIENLWEKKDGINFIENTEARNAVLEVLDNLDKGKLRVCENIDGNWIVNQWLKKNDFIELSNSRYGNHIWRTECS